MSYSDDADAVVLSEEELEADADNRADAVGAVVVLVCLVTGFLLMVAGFDGF